MSAAGDRSFAGIALCVFALLAFALQDSLVKSLTERYPVLQVLVMRTSVVLILLPVIGVSRWGTSILKSANPRPMMLRGVFAFAAFSTYYLALTTVPLADAAAVYMTAPLFVTLLSVLILGERVGLHRVTALIVGFIAILIMLNPGSDLFRIEAALPLFSAMSYAMIPILTRRIGLKEHPLTMAIYTTLSYLVLCIIASVILHWIPADADADHGQAWKSLTQSWVMPARQDIYFSILAGCIFAVGLLSITQAYRISVVSSVAPFEYSYLVWASVLGFIFFGDIPSQRILLGGLIIVAAGCYIMFRERKQRG